VGEEGGEEELRKEWEERRGICKEAKVCPLRNFGKRGGGCREP